MQNTCLLSSAFCNLNLISSLVKFLIGVFCGVKRFGVGHFASFIIRSKAKPLLASTCLTGLKFAIIIIKLFYFNF